MHKQVSINEKLQIGKRSKTDDWRMCMNEAVVHTGL